MSHENPIRFEELFNIEELQQLQDQITSAFGVASLITHPDGTPITRPSNFNRLCQNIIRCTEKGKLNCKHSDAIIGRHHPYGPVVQPCLSGGLWDAGASITVGNQHVANWLIGQVRNEAQDEDRMREYAREIGADEADFMQAYREIPTMPEEKFQQLAQVLYTMARQLSEKAYYNLQQSKFIAEKQLAEKALLESEERYRTTLYSIGDGVITTDVEGKVKMMNAIAEQLTGWIQQDATGKSLEIVFPIINEETRQQVEIPVRRVLREGVIVGLANHTLLIAKDGTERPIADSAAPIRNEHGEISGVVLVFSDQTEQQMRRKLLEQRLTLFEVAGNSNLQETLTQILDEIGRFTNSPICFLHFMPEHKKSFGLQTYLSTTTTNDFCQSNERGLYCKNCGNSCWNEQINIIKPRVENNFISEPDKSGMPFVHPKITRELVVPVLRDNQVVAILGIGNKLNEYTDFDIETVSFLADVACEIAEDKIREENLQRSEERFQHLFERAPLGYQSLNEDGYLFEVNEAWCETLGYQKEDVIGKWFGDFLAPEYVDKFRERFSLFKRIGKTHTDLEMVHQCGERRFIAFEGRIGYKNDGSFEKTHCILRDVTEIRKIEAELRKSEDKYRQIAENINDVVWTTDLKLKTTYVSPSIERLLGETAEVHMSRSMEEKYPPDSLQKIISILSEELEKDNDPNHDPKRNRIFEVEHYHANGSKVWLSMNVSFIRDGQGRPIGLQGTTRDISERKQMEEALRQSEEKMRGIVQVVPTGIGMVRNRMLIEVNPRFAEMTGYSVDELIERSSRMLYSTQEEYDQVENLYKQIIEEGTGIIESRWKRKDGSIIEVIVSAKSIEKYDTSKGIIFASLDITERKLAEKREKEHAQNLSNILESISDAFISLDTNWCYTYMNKKAGEIFGRDPKEMIGKHIWTEFPEGVGQVFYHTYYKAAETKEFQFLEEYYPPYDLWFENRIYPSEAGLSIFFHDISERKRADRKLKEQERQLNSMVGNLPGFVYRCKYDENWTMLYVSQGCQSITGYLPEDLIGNKTISFNEIIKEEYRDFLFAQWKQVIANKTTFYQEYEIITASGEIRWVLEQAVVVYDENNNVEFLEGYIDDISERKQALAKLTESEAKYRNLFQNHSAIKLIVDPSDGNIVDANRAAVDFYGWSYEELTQKKIWQINALPSEQVKQKMEEEQELKNLHFEFKHCKANGEIIDVEVFTSQIMMDGKEYLHSIIHDITEKKEAESALKESEEKNRLIMDNSMDAILLTKPDGSILSTNRAACSLFDMTEEEICMAGRDGLVDPNDSRLNDLLVQREKYGFAAGELNFMRKDGNRFTSEISSSLFKDSKGELFTSMIIRDITDRIRMEANLRESEETIRLLFNSTAEGIYGIDTSGECTFCNKAGLTMLGYTDESELLGKNMHQLMHHSHKDGTFHPAKECRVYKAFIDGSGSHCDQEVFWTKSGDSFPVEYWSYPILRDNKVIGSVVTFIDITQKQKLSAELARSESKYRYLFENNPAPMWIYDLETLAFLEVNEAAIDHYGYSREEFLKLSLKDIRPTEDVGKLIQDVDTTFDVLNRAGTWQHKKKSGEIIYVDIVSHKIDYESRPARLVISTDITSRVNMQLEIDEERQLLRTLINNLPVAVYIENLEGKTIITNRADWERFGFQDESQIIGKTAVDLYKNEAGHRSFLEDMRVIQTGKAIINREEFFPIGSGDIRFFLSSRIPLYDRDHKIMGLLGVDREITESKKANAQILKLSRSVEQSPSIVEITDKNGKIEYVNAKFIEITGYSKEEVIGQNPRILNSGMMSAEFYKTLWNTISKGATWSGEIQNRKKSGELYWDRTIISPLRNEHGEITNYIATKEDITDRKRMEEELVRAKEKAEGSDRLKSAFLANMSHEVRTPLNSIIGFSELLSDPDFGEDDKKDFIYQITLNGNNLLNVISDIVDISKIEAGEIAIRKKEVKVCELMEQMKKQHFIQKTEKPIEFRWVCHDDSKNLVVLADKERLQQVLNNLLSNALKFTSEGYIEVGYQSVNDFVEFHVKDTGIGISEDFYKQIFERFYQVETSYTRKYGGNGLGLAISKNLVELMGGKIWVESEVGEGATFYFTLPKF